MTGYCFEVWRGEQLGVMILFCVLCIFFSWCFKFWIWVKSMILVEWHWISWETGFEAKGILGELFCFTFRKSRENYNLDCVKKKKKKTHLGDLRYLTIMLLKSINCTKSLLPRRYLDLTLQSNYSSWNVLQVVTDFILWV